MVKQPLLLWVLILGMWLAAVQAVAAQSTAGSCQSTLASTTDCRNAPLTPREAELLQRVQKLEERLNQLETRLSAAKDQEASSMSRQKENTAGGQDGRLETAQSSSPSQDSSIPLRADSQARPSDEHRALPDLLEGATLSAAFDGYYGFNFNKPVGGVNLLRAYDVTSNSFNLNQTGVVIERAANVEGGRRFGLRLDLMYGQATETLQGSAQNEPRPQVFRPVFQAYGTYIFPIGSGLTVDFGKMASPMGYENNYTKDQMNYSRSLWFDFLPFYHYGLRSSYNFNSRVTLRYWLINGINQTEDFNGFKSHAVNLTVSLTPAVSWNLNYHVGREQRALAPDLNPAIPTLLTQPGLSVTPVEPIPRGRMHIVDSYASWTATKKLLLVGEGDYVVNRFQETSVPSVVFGGAGYVRYQFTPQFSLASRLEYLGDKGGLFSGKSQALKEASLTATYQFAEGFQTRLEYRRDFSNLPFFLTSVPGLLRKEQSTATLGLIWWFGGKQGAW
jgi:hypothetical protein